MTKNPNALTNTKQMLDTVGKIRKSRLESSDFSSRDRKDHRLVTRAHVTATNVAVTHEWGPVPQQSRTAVSAFIRGYRAAGGTSVSYHYSGSIQMHNQFGADVSGHLPSSAEALAEAGKRWDEFFAEVPVDRSTKSTRKRIPILQPGSFAPPVPMPVIAPAPISAPEPVVAAPGSAFAAFAAEAAAAYPDPSQYT